MKLLDYDETIVIITGSSASAEERDRPLAEELKARIDALGAGHAYRRAVLVTDQQFLMTMRDFHANPTIAIGGPGVNGVAAELAGVIPAVHNEGDRVIVQAELEGDAKRVACWGTDAAATARAVAIFVEDGHLERLLARVWRFRTDLFT